ncbi:hypothetical protein FBU31_006421 [Coemansia sp. 'formosensis']|nr:hypothetical protein FBU31_006421 [Coemansia sp. 'formosensis']
MYGAGFGDTYEDELYRDDHSTEDSASDAIDSDTEEKILSHIYYQSTTPTQATRLPRTEADSDSSEGKYQIEKKRRKVHSSADFIRPQNDASDEESISVTVVRPYRSATLSDEESGSAAVDIRDVSFNTQDDLAVDSYLDSVTTTGLATPVPHADEAMEHHHIQIDSLQLTSPGIQTHAVLVRTGDPDDEYGYLDEAEIQGRNRYFMEEKEIICRKCHRPGHIAKDCTTMTCMTCGKDGHMSKDCKMTGNVCHSCNMRGHIASECPQRSGTPRSRGCDRCNSRTHHTEECATIWRRYVYAGPRPKQYADVTAWCYNCAARGHFGDNCQMRRSQGALAYQGDTAFGSVNCPGKMIHVSESQRPAHYDSSRQHSSHEGNREDRRREHGYGPRRHQGDSHDSRNGSRHHQNSSGGNSASRRPNRDHASGGNKFGRNSSSGGGGGGYHARPQQTPTGAVRNQHRRY